MDDEKSLARHITQPATWWAAFEKQAKSQGMSLSEWAGECMLARVPMKEARKLPLRSKRGGRRAR